jgi:hypothetical protein
MGRLQELKKHIYARFFLACVTVGGTAKETREHESLKLVLLPRPQSDRIVAASAVSLGQSLGPVPKTGRRGRAWRNAKRDVCESGAVPLSPLQENVERGTCISN